MCIDHFPAVVEEKVSVEGSAFLYIATVVHKEK